MIYEGKSAKKNEIKQINKFTFETNFNSKRINSYFSNLSSLNFPQLLYLKKEYEELDYSTIDIRVHLHKIVSFPIYLTVMSIFSAIIMFSIKYQKNTILNIIGGVFISVLIYYLNFLINAMGTSGVIPLIISVWLPLIILVFFSLIWLVTLNEK